MYKRHKNPTSFEIGLEKEKNYYTTIIFTSRNAYGGAEAVLSIEVDFENQNLTYKDLMFSMDFQEFIESLDLEKEHIYKFKGIYRVYDNEKRIFKGKLTKARINKELSLTICETVPIQFETERELMEDD